jgi:A/G-specific adenine glycosylase
VDYTAFQKHIGEYYRVYGRAFPWRATRDPYRILVSEFMLQQTQVERVRGKYKEFLRAFPTAHALAHASSKDVLAIWQGLGYNRRALALQRTARMLVSEYRGRVPPDPTALLKLPGVGPSTAGALCAFAFNQPEAFIETNIRRVYIHHFFESSKKPISDVQIMPLIEKTLDRSHPREWYYALMDYGSALSKQMSNPNQRSAHYTKQGAFRGSNRQLRGHMLKLLLERPMTLRALARATAQQPGRVTHMVSALHKEGFVRVHGQRVAVIS